MSKLHLLADRIKATKARLDRRADELASRLDVMDSVAPTVFGRAHSFMDSQEADVQSLDDGLRELSNLPLDVAPASPANSTTLAPAVPVVEPAAPAPFVPPITTWTETAPAMEGAKWADDELPSGVPANVAAALSANKGE